ncbi:2'-5' RNA ligase family protein [Streptomyces cyaneofuscatus]|uniref:2'-5' RNA ligase family protein n=1 Tax=Streptomyces cyaneofuscatus TaxID=66883 RepID=UPI0037BD9C09
MADDGAQGIQAGRSGLIVRVPEADPLVRAWRDRLDPSARAGVPAHVTVLFPFLDLDVSRIDEGVRAAIGEALGRHRSFEARSFEARFDHCGRFPGVLSRRHAGLGGRPAVPRRDAVAAEGLLPPEVGGGGVMSAVARGGHASHPRRPPGGRSSRAG